MNDPVFRRSFGALGLYPIGGFVSGDLVDGDHSVVLPYRAVVLAHQLDHHDYMKFG